MSTIHSTTLPDYIEAGSPKRLRFLMYEVNAKLGGMVYFHNIQTYVNKRGQTRWVAWYYKRIEDVVNELG